MSIGDTDHHDTAVRRGVNPPGKNKHGEPTGLPTQMTHAWISYVLPEEKLTAPGHRLRTLITEYEEGEINCPYQRWISLVTGRQLSKHKKSNGSTHDIQLLMNLPDTILIK
ncbi:hypothetical protein [Janthinobacterium sp. CG_S6]|uniref:hypothetical protein n=1 Tax=Janthinobacterium sp. CG_S6 TaxID=3071707 RepID=UPI002E00897D|nr:hypothetical protein [Janthinobacterium sp. CG_S6]